MIKRKELKEGCIAHANDDEPVFVLRAKDRLAPALVDAWASFAELMGATYTKTSSARVLANDMRAYAAVHFKDGKVPD